MAISQLLVNDIEWNTVHFVAEADEIAFTMHTNLKSDYISISSCMVDTVCIYSMHKKYPYTWKRFGAETFRM